MRPARQDDRPAIPADNPRMNEESRASRDGDLKVERALDVIEDLIEVAALGDAAPAGESDVRTVGGDERINRGGSSWLRDRCARGYDPSQRVDQLRVGRPKLDRNAIRVEVNSRGLIRSRIRRQRLTAGCHRRRRCRHREHRRQPHGRDTYGRDSLHDVATSPRTLKRRRVATLEQVHARELVEGIEDDCFVGLDVQLLRQHRRDLRERMLSVAVLPDNARHPVQRVRFLAVLVEDDRLVSNPIYEETVLPRARVHGAFREGGAP